MDELELLKANWNKREQELPSLSYHDIYKMLLKKSSSIVKWIFVISIAELLFWLLIGLITPESNKNLMTNIGLNSILNVVYILHYAVIIVFLVLFYLNWKNIKVTDSAKVLMENILKTRKTVKYFVVYNVVGTATVLLFVNLYFYTKQTELYAYLSQNNTNYGAIPEETFTSIFFISQLIVGVLLIGFVLLFYRVIYGILLKRLKNNYNELKKIEL